MASCLECIEFSCCCLLVSSQNNFWCSCLLLRCHSFWPLYVRLWIGRFINLVVNFFVLCCVYAKANSKKQKFSFLVARCYCYCCLSLLLSVLVLTKAPRSDFICITSWNRKHMMFDKYGFCGYFRLYFLWNTHTLYMLNVQ